MNSDRMFELAQALAVAKSRQDVPAALAVLHDDMLLETPAFGTSARGLAENAKVLTRFFASFPDPHGPYCPPKPYADMYDPAGMPPPLRRKTRNARHSSAPSEGW